MKFAENLGTRVVSGWSRVLFVSFVFGFVVRLIPEVLSLSYPIGYDPIYYVWTIKNSVVWSNWSRVFSTWLLDAILVVSFNATRLDPFVLVKFAAALLFGFNACGVYYFATKALGWTIKKALLAAVFFSLQMAALAFSANFYRNMLGLGILLFALPLIKDEFKTPRRFLVFASLSVLVVFAHEYGSVVLFTVVLGFVVSRFLKPVKINVLRLSVAVLPALALFLVSFYFIVFPLPSNVETNVILAYGPTGNYPKPFFFLKNYLATSAPAQYYPAYLGFASQVFSLFAGLYIVVLPLVLVGSFKDDVLDSWTVLLLIGSFGALVTPLFAFDLWYRWMLMLVYPFSFYAANGFTRILRSSRRTFGLASPRVRWAKLADGAVKLVLVLPLVLGLVFIATSIQGTAVPVRDVDDTIRAMRWLNARMDDGSALLMHDAFSHLARLYLDNSHVTIYFRDDVQRAIDVALKRVWLNENVGWFSLTVPDGFVAVFSSGRVSAFEYSR